MINHSPRITQDSLVLHLDAGNPKSFKGEPTTNLITNPIDSYPSVGNGWGTYQTNQYNGGSYFSIGTITSVTGNVVTFTPAWTLRTYDVIRPQTTGGGVTAGTDYFVKMLATNQFSLHAYNSSQDGSQGFSVHNTIINDTRISINATGFPTIWWGAAHLPNSDIVKTIIPNGFKLKDRVHDCLRCNFFRTDGVQGYMAYGVYPAVILGHTYTVSCQYKAGTTSAIGMQWFLQSYNSGDTSWSNTSVLTLSSSWQKVSLTFTAGANGNLNLYWPPYASMVNPYAMDISEIQVEDLGHASEYTSSSRGTTVATNGGLADLSSGTNHGDIYGSPVVETDSGVPCFNFATVSGGNSSAANMGFTFASNMITRTGGFTFSCWIKNPPTNAGQTSLFSNASGGDGFRFGVAQDAVYFLVGPPYTEGAIYYSSPFDNNKWHNVALIYDRLGVLNSGTPRMQLYLDGAYQTSPTIPINQAIATNTAPGIVRNQSGTALYTGKLAIFSAYNKCLTATEVLNNYNALKGRFGL